MPTICPNCLHPLRTNAKFCGYCGTSLIPNTRADAITLQASPQEVDTIKENTSPPAQSKPKSKKNIRRIVLIVLIILLCLVLLVAFLVHYWPNIIPNFGSLISRMLPK
ncbi:MAG: hypothetical protein A2Y88_01085 [Chloroflexi bacterium RBG_13_48_10]|nr:MAG: hypothetical protein A2Y88_01085 [Chloroflexi bacterium RBG_13_48_10]